MKTKYLYIIGLILLVFSGCETDITKTMVQEGIPPVLTATQSNNSTFVLEKDNAENVILELNWTDPNYFGEDANGNVVGTYTIEIDKTDQFLDPYKVVIDNLNHSFLVSELNKILLDLECTVEVNNDIYVRVKSLFLNTDELLSNVLKYGIAPYSIIPPPAIIPPAELYLVGDATDNPWVYPIPDTQKFTKETETLFTLTINLYGNSAYALITDVAGSNWTPNFRLDPNVDPATVTNAGVFVAGGEGYDLGWTTINLLTPDKDSTYKLTFNFQTGTYTVVDIVGPPAITPPSELYLVGDATVNPWTYPIPNGQKFVKESETLFTLTIDLFGNSAYALITDVTGDNWTPNFRLDPNVDPATVVNGGSFVAGGEGYDLGWSTINILSPDKDSTYKLSFDFQTATFTVIEQ